jgi:protein involved in polysaccharide export with SLBB domain
MRSHAERGNKLKTPEIPNSETRDRNVLVLIVWVSDFGFRIWSLFRISGFGFRISVLVALLSGCATNRNLDKELLAPKPSANREVANGYHVQCPDVLEVAADFRPDIPAGRRVVGPDGCIDLGPAGRVRVEGMSPAQIAARMAVAAAVPVATVRVRVAEYRSQRVYVFGQVTGLQRAVPYQGPETIRDFLQRAGGLAPGAEPSEVHVVRANVADGKRPEVFAVDLKAIVMQHDERTNIRLDPFDEVFIGETRQSSYEKAIPPILRPLYERLVNMDRPKQGDGVPPAGDATPLGASLARR